MALKKYIFMVFIIFFGYKYLDARCSFLIVDRKTEKIVGQSMSYFTDNGLKIHSMIYILQDGKKYIEFKEYLKPESLAKTHEFFLSRIKWKDTGIENEYWITVKINDKEWKFQLFGDITYVYLKDETGNILKDVDAFAYILNKDKEIMDFFEILLSTKFKFADCFQYVFDKKKGAKKLNIKKKKYKFKPEYIPCTEAEKALGYECEKYIYESKYHKNCRRQKQYKNK